MMLNIEAATTLLLAFLMAIFSSLARADLAPADKALVEKAVENRQVDPASLDASIARLEQLEKETLKPDEGVSGNLARLYFFKADGTDDKDTRIKIYEKAIEASERTAKIDPESLLGNFWGAAAIGRRGLDVGIFKDNVLKKARPMKERLERCLKVDEKYEAGGPHRALSRLYYKIPGWPISFGDNDKALEHGRKALEIAPDNAWNQVYLAEVLIKKDRKDEAKKLLEKVLASPKPAKLPKEYERYTSEARELMKKI